MNEREPNFFEKAPESIPTPEEIQSVFDQLIEGEYETKVELKDEKGIYKWDVIVPGDDGKTEYGYMRKGRHAEGDVVTSTSIHVVFYDKDGEPAGGHDVAECVDGNWKLTP